mgnify:CR=1 FL=1
MALISDIPTITATQASALESVTLFTLDDLLRTERGALVRRLPQITLTEIRGWQAIAELSQLDTITVAEAAALQAAGVSGIDEFSDWDLARLRPILTQRDDEQLLALAKGSVRLRHTGVVNGNVRLRDETPVEGARVTVAGRDAVTDARGRFRVIGLPLDNRVAVAGTHPQLGHKLLTAVPVRRAGALVAVTLVLGGRPRAPRRYSQRRGDTLPPLGSSVITTRVESTPPETDDLLVISGRYARGDYRVASEFLDFEDGVFVRRLYRLPAASVPAAAVVSDGLGWRNDAWTIRKHCAKDVARRVRLRAAARRLSGTPGSAAEASAQARAILAAASDR